MMTLAFAPHYRHGKTWLRCEGPTVLLYGQTWPGLSIVQPYGECISARERASVIKQGIEQALASADLASDDCKPLDPEFSLAEGTCWLFMPR